MGYVASLDLVAAARAGHTRAIARLLTRAESGVAEARPALDAMFAHAGRAHVVGITGVPGSGKSTLVALVAAAIRKQGRTVAIVAIDPSSPFSGGAILGDRIRMGELGGDPGVFVRSMATRGALGGLARGTLEAVDVLDASGFDVVMIETVGVGQDEVDVARAAHTTVVVSAPGLGDDIQAIKAGVLEIADIHVVSKCDKPDANRTIADLKSMLILDLANRPGWKPPVLPTSAATGEGVDALVAAVDAHRAALEQSGEIATRRALIDERRLLKASEELLRDRFERARDGRVASLLAAMAARELSPHAAATRLLAALPQGETA
ncbi:MAG: methylmalonyl Co-A mutase-associated GTPase MeaB [Proteobacteria bacterium]|nr:methylmalonyl Co-A mutase-associated GTPase MeaB [Pseudomonadota bacterium]